MAMSEYLRKAVLEDSKFIYDLRNDDLTRMNSINKEIIAYDKHMAWYERKLQDNDTYIYILTDGSDNIGQVRLDIDKDKALISYAISPSHRGLGYGTKILTLIEDKILEYYENINLRGCVLKENIVSKKIFLKLGYTVIDDEDNIVIFEKNVHRK